MDLEKPTKPNFLIIGAQKAGTTWLWRMLVQHPGTSLPETKEIHYFGSAEIYQRGREWYYNHFTGLDSSKVIGEASTTYLYDRVPYWYNKSNQLKFDDSLPTIPELIANELPDIKVIINLRDPVTRAISAYKHWIREANISPLLGLKKTAIMHPKTRILEYGYYPQYIKIWKEFVPPERMRIVIFEEEVVKSAEKTIHDIYEYLGLDSSFVPTSPEKPVHTSWTWTRILFNYYTKSIPTRLRRSRIGVWLDRHDFLEKYAITHEDIEFLQETYLPEKEELERLLGRRLDCWRYGRS